MAMPKELDIKLFELEQRFEKARRSEVPAHAPRAFAAARALLQKARRGQRTIASADDVEAATSALQRAVDCAATAQPQMASLVDARTRAVRNGMISRFAARELNVAERLYTAAVGAAETGQPNTRQLIEEAAAAFHAAVLASFEQGPVRQLEQSIGYARHIVSPAIRTEAQAELTAVRESLQAVKAGELSPSLLGIRMGAISILARRLQDFGPGVPIDPELIDWPQPPDGGWDPETFGPPKPPTQMRIVSRTATSVSLTWKDESGFDVTNTLERSTNDGPWEAVREWGPRNGWTNVVDSGLQPDTEYRYRVRVQSAFRASATTRDNQVVCRTHSNLSLPLVRVQVRIRIADVADAGSDDGLQIKLNSPLPNYVPRGNSTWLDHPPRMIDGDIFAYRDDLARGSDTTYDLKYFDLSNLTDITMLSLSKPGDDALGIAEVELLVNNRPVFHKFFGETAGSCLWLDQGEAGGPPSYAVWAQELRAHDSWQAYVAAPPTPLDAAFHVFPQARLVSQLEAVIGDRLHGTPAYWRRVPWGALRIEKRDPETVDGIERVKMHVEIKLAGDAPYLPNPDLDIGFDLSMWITCNTDNTEATFHYETSNVSVSADFDLVVDLLGLIFPLGLGVLAVRYIEDEVEAAFIAGWRDISEDSTFSTPGFCLRMVVTDEADGSFTVNIVPG